MVTLNPNDTFPYHSSADESPFAKKHKLSQHSVGVSISAGRFSPQMKEMCQQSSLRLLDNFKWKKTMEAKVTADTKDF